MTTTVTTAETGPLTANGVTPLAFTFQALSAAEIAVYRNGILAAANTYTVALNVDGTGTVTPLATWGSDSVLILSDPDFQQLTQFERFVPTYPDLLNAPLDRLARSIIGLRSYVDRAIAVVAAQVTSITNYLQAGAGAILRSFQDRLRENVYVSDFGAVGFGLDDTPAIHAAAATLGAAGGVVRVSRGQRLLIDTNLTLPANVTLRGPHMFLGSPKDNTLADYAQLGGALIVNSAATITAKGGAGLHGLLIHRKAMTFPAPNASAFAGTAVTAGGDDVAVVNCMLLGFNLGFSATGHQRPMVFDNKFDCNSAILIDTCYDIAYVTRNHAWPFATIAAVAGGALPSINKRPGTAFKFTGVNDWSKATENFSYGYLVGTHVFNCEHMTVLNGGADNTDPVGYPHENAIGFLANGTSRETRFIGCQAAAQENAYYVDTTAGFKTNIQSSDAWGTQSNGIVIASGDVSIGGGGSLRGGVSGVVVTSAASVVTVDETHFDSISGAPISSTVSTAKVRIGDNNTYLNCAAASGTNLVIEAIASAASVTLPHAGTEFSVTGTTGISALLRGRAGRRVTLVFNAAVTITHSTANSNSMSLNGGVNFAAVAGSTLSLLHTGGQWFETGRKA